MIYFWAFYFMWNKKQLIVSIDFEQKALLWAETKQCYCFLNGNNCDYTYDSFPKILAIGFREQTILRNEKQELDTVLNSKQYQFGYFAYDLFSNNQSNTSDFPKGYFFSPETVIRFNKNQEIEIESIYAIEEIINTIESFTLLKDLKSKNITFVALESKANYIEKIEQLKQHINRGNIYQINYCIEFEAYNAIINPIEVYQKLNNQSPMPFSGLMKLGHQYIICASPERYLKRIESLVISQPMKGTAPRHPDPIIDNQNKSDLKNSAKERAENTMIVDLVRNDLSRFCKSGTVEVEKMHEIYSFFPVHQMVTTITGTITDQTESRFAIEQSFPMGSMTGAPKIRAMELIDKFENKPRGAFSGAMGFVEPNGNFDFNVLIRSIFYNTKTKKLTYNVGSGITSTSDSEKEYEECMLKASIIQKVLSNN